MKHCTRAFIPLLTASTLLTFSCGAVSLSPGLSRIAETSTMIKSGPLAEIRFTQEDFTRATLAEDLNSITITSLPAVSSGVLYLGSVPLAVNQNISASSLSNLRFVPAKQAESGSFTFRFGEDYAMTCQLRITEEVNLAPTISESQICSAAWTQKDISCFGTLSASDPEGDALCFEILEYPAKGLLALTDSTHGDFRYTPYSGYSGEDSFLYRVRDSYGNYSEPSQVTVRIDRQNASLVFADMSDHWAHSAAITMACSGIMDYAQETGMALFYPEKPVTREEFVVMVMRALDFEPDVLSVHTVFADDSAISEEARPYVNAAFNAGIIHGREEGGSLLFSPASYITRAESAVIVNNIIGAEVPMTVSAFTDSASIPVWAQSSLYALNHLGILRGTGAGAISPYAAITRAQAAQILLNFTQYVG